MLTNKHEPEIRRLRRSGVTMDEAARRLGLKTSSIKTYCARLGITGWPSATKAARDARNSIICDMYAVNAPVAEIATAVGMSVNVLKVTAHHLGCTRTPKEAARMRWAMRGEARA